MGSIPSVPTLQRVLGLATARLLHQRAHGHDPRPVSTDALSRSLSREHRFSLDELDAEQHRRALLALAEQVGAQLRSEEHVFGALSLTVRYADRSITTRTRTLADATHHSAPGMTVCQRGVGVAVGCVTARGRPDLRRLLRRRTTRMLFGAVL